MEILTWEYLIWSILIYTLAIICVTIAVYYDASIKIKALKKTNSANQTWNTRYRDTIDELKEEIKFLDGITTNQIERIKELVIGVNEVEKENKLCKNNEDRVRWELFNSNKKIDESKIVTEKLLTMVKKGKMEEAKEIVKEFYQM